MSFKTHTTSTTYYEDAAHGSFELPFGGDFYQEMLHVSEDGLTAVLGMLCQDGDAEDPFDGDEGEFYQFNRSYAHDIERIEPEDFKRIIRAHPGRVFATNDRNDYSANIHPIAGPFTAKDTRGKKGEHGDGCKVMDVIHRMGGYYIAPEDATDPAAYAKSALESYSAWCNGEVYGVMVWVYSRPDTESPWELDEESRDSECWGFIGAEYATEELKREFDEAIK